jgi:hypothetical protein
MKLWHVAAKALVVAFVALLLRLTSDPFTMVQGSDFTSFVISPALTVQIACLAVLAGALVIRTSPAFSVARWAVALCAVLIASHRLVIDNLNHQIRDVYVAAPIQSLDLDPAREGGLAALPTIGGFRIGPAGANAALWCFSPPLIGLDRTALGRAL